MLAEPTLLEPVLEQDEKGVTPEISLVRRVQKGDPLAFEQLYRKCVGRVYAICLRMLGDRARAEELTQDVFVRTWEMIGTFRGESPFTSWLYRLAVNVSLVHLRSERRRSLRFVMTGDFSRFKKENEVFSPGVGVDLENAIASLPPRARIVFVLHDVEGYRHEEIAELMGLALGTTKAQLHRARKLLKEVLGK